jgi:hypothetical protein
MMLPGCTVMIYDAPEKSDTLKLRMRPTFRTHMRAAGLHRAPEHQDLVPHNDRSILVAAAKLLVGG